MPIKILMPALSPTMTEGNLVKWHKKVGDTVKAGDLLAEIETDKATMEVEAVDEGILAKILIADGAQNVAVNAIIAVLLEVGEDKTILNTMDFGTVIKAAVVVEPDIKVELTTLKTELTSQTSTSDLVTVDRIFASPLAKRIASDQKINLSNVLGTGPHGRIVKADILDFVNSEKLVSCHESSIVRSKQEYQIVPNNNIRKVIAKRLSESKQTIPHSYLSVDCNVNKLLELRHDVNRARDEESSMTRISVNDLMIKAVGLTLKAIPEANSSWTDDAILLYNNIDISVAVSIHDGLITPIIFNVDQKSIFTISKEMKELVTRARNGTLKPHEFQGGGFSISNLGMFGIKQFNAIINPPQSCILAISASVEIPIVNVGKIEIASMMTVTLSFDHRVLDGAMGAKFLQALKAIIESPVRLLLGY